MTFDTNLAVISDGKSSDNLRGTAAEFVQKKLKVNGVEVDAIAMSVFAKYGLVKVQGEAEKIPGKRGRCGKILAFSSNVNFKVEV